MKKVILSVFGTVLFAGINYAADLEVDVVEADFEANNGEIDLSVTGGAAPFVFDWSGPGGFTSSDEDLTDLEPGTYTVVVTDKYCGVATLDVVVEEEELNTSSIDEQTPFQISLYPNPTSGLVNIQSSELVDVVVYNVVGERILGAKNVNQIDLSNFPSGVYMVQLTSVKGTVTRKVTLQ